MKFLRDDALWVVVALPPRATAMAVMIALLPPEGEEWGGGEGGGSAGREVGCEGSREEFTKLQPCTLHNKSPTSTVP